MKDMVNGTKTELKRKSTNAKIAVITNATTNLVVFDQGGELPSVFSAIVLIYILTTTYRKNNKAPWIRSFAQFHGRSSFMGK